MSYDFNQSIELNQNLTHLDMELKFDRLIQLNDKIKYLNSNSYDLIDDLLTSIKMITLNCKKYEH